MFITLLDWVILYDPKRIKVYTAQKLRTHSEDITLFENVPTSDSFRAIAAMAA